MTMTGTKWSTAAASGTRKAIAVVAAGALVASLSYFHLWGNTPAIAASDTGQVDVFFNLDSDVTVQIGSETFDALSDEAYTASAADDLRFKAATQRSDREIGEVSAVQRQNSSHAQARVASNENDAVEDEALSSSESDQSEFNAVELVTAEEETTPIPETAAALKAKKEAEAAAEGEVLEDDETPMAAAPQGGDDEEVVEVIVTYDPDEEEYVISKDELQKAATATNAVQVTITSDAQGETCDNWDDLAAFLADDGEGKVKLSQDITATTTVVVKGAKTLDLNGHTITSDVKDALFKVGDDKQSATLTINDSASKYLDLEEVSEGVALPKPSKENAGDLINGILGEFREKWVGQKATVDGDTLTYYVTRSYEDGVNAGTTTEYQIKHTVDMEPVGTIKATTAQDIVVVDNSSSTLNIEGGRLSFQKDVNDDIHAVNLNKGGTLHMSGGFITDVSTIGLGGAISANNASTNAAINITIDGTAVIAGNKTPQNGGAIWISSGLKNLPAKLTVGGNAVIAGNEAGTAPTTHLNKGSIASIANGGGIYARKNCEVTLTGSAVITGNVANADGGGIYMQGRGDESTKNKLVIEQNAMITNNRSENDRSEVHHTDRSTNPHPANETNYWQYYGGGGGGVFTLDETIITGGQITANFASDAGGGILALGGTKLSGTTMKIPELKIENCRISSNYAGTSEGGGICAGAAKASYIKQGIISNNMTATYYDYGGGGLFLSSIDQGKTAGMTLYHPLVTGNTAAGLGGGVAACTNGVVVSCDAAVFDNAALEENTTQNPVEYGDQWLLEGNLKKDEFKGAGQKTYGLKGNVEKGYANDFYCARESTVFNSMLGGGWYNWKGYTTNNTGGGEMDAVRDGAYRYIRLNYGSPISVTNVLYHSQYNALMLIVPANQVDTTRSLMGYVVTYDTIDLSNGNQAVKASAVVEGIDESNPFSDTLDSSRPTEKIMVLYLSDPVDRESYSGQDLGIDLLNAYTSVDKMRTYDVLKVDKLSQSDTTYVTGDRLMFLTAFPTEEDKQAARDEAVLFFTGNYSNTHGGAIACNDYIDVGAAGKEIPERPETGKGLMTLTKTLTGWDAAQEGSSATAVFTVTGYADVEAYKAQLSPIYVNMISMSFNADGSEDKVLTDLPLGFYVVEEVFYTGDNFKESAGRNMWTVTLTDDNAEEGVSHEFTNTYKDERTFGTGVVNSYAPTEDENGLFSYADGKLTYTPDDNYTNRKQPSAPIEGGN